MTQKSKQQTTQTVRKNIIPVERVVPDLCGIVKHSAARFLDNFFQRFVLPFGAFHLQNASMKEKKKLKPVFLIIYVKPTVSLTKLFRFVT